MSEKPDKNTNASWYGWHQRALNIWFLPLVLLRRPAILFPRDRAIGFRFTFGLCRNYFLQLAHQNKSNGFGSRRFHEGIGPPPGKT